jgi:hypothetical protein
VAARRGGKIGIVLVILLMVIVGVLFVADRIAVRAAEDQIAQQTKKELVARNVTMAADPKVSIAGFPFLTQVIGGTYKKITISVAQPKINNVQLATLDVAAESVHANARAVMNGTGDVVADKVTGTMTIGWDAVRSIVVLAGLPQAIDPTKVDLRVTNNAVQVKIPMTINNFNFTIIANGTLVVQAGKVQIHLDSVTTDQGSLPPVVQGLINTYKKQLTATLNVPQLPYAMVVNKVQSSDTGLLIIATADNVKLTG